jgi:hypothetical protein
LPPEPPISILMLGAPRNFFSPRQSRRVANSRGD